MMSHNNVINFPVGNERDWPKIEVMVRKFIMEDTKASDVLADHVCIQLKDVYFKYNTEPLKIEITAPAGEYVVDVVNDVAGQVAEYFQKTINSLLYEIVIREVDLYFSKKDD